MDDTGVIDDPSPSFSEPLALEVADSSGLAWGSELVPTPEPFLDWLDSRHAPGLGSGIGMGPISFAEGLCAGLLSGPTIEDPLERMGGAGLFAAHHWLIRLNDRLEQTFRPYRWAGMAERSILPTEEEELELDAEEVVRQQREARKRQQAGPQPYVALDLFGEEEAQARAHRKAKAGRAAAAAARPEHQQASRSEARRAVIRQRAEEALRRSEQETARRLEQAEVEQQLRREREEAAHIAAAEQRQARLAEIAERAERQQQLAAARRQQELERAIRQEEARDRAREQARVQRQLTRLAERASGIPDRRLARWLASLTATAVAMPPDEEQLRLVAEATRQVEQAHAQALAARQQVEVARAGGRGEGEEDAARLRQRSSVQRQLDRLAGQARQLPDREAVRWIESLAAQASDPQAPLPDERTLTLAAQRIAEARRALQRARAELEGEQAQARSQRADAAQPAPAQRSALLARLGTLASLAREIDDGATRRWVESVAALASDPRAAQMDEQMLARVVERIEQARRHAAEIRQQAAAEVAPEPAVRIAARQAIERLARLSRDLPDPATRRRAESLVALAAAPDAPLPPVAAIEQAIRQAEQSRAAAAAEQDGDRARRATLQQSIARLQRLAQASPSSETRRWVDSLAALASHPDAPLPEPAVLEAAIRKLEATGEAPQAAASAEARAESARRAALQPEIERLAALSRDLPDAATRQWAQSLAALAADPSAPLPAAELVAQAIRRAEVARERAAVQGRIERLEKLARTLPEGRARDWVESLSALATDPAAPLPELAAIEGTIRRLEQAERAEQAKSQVRERAEALRGIERLAELSRELPEHELSRWVGSLTELASDADAPLPDPKLVAAAVQRLEQAVARQRPKAAESFARRIEEARQRAQLDAAGFGLPGAAPGAGISGALELEQAALERLDPGQRRLLVAQLRRTGGRTLQAAGRVAAPLQRNILRALLDGRLQPEELGLAALPPAPGPGQAERRSDMAAWLPSGATMREWPLATAEQWRGAGRPVRAGQVLPAPGVWRSLQLLSTGPLPAGPHGAALPGAAKQMPWTGLDIPLRLEGPGTGIAAARQAAPLPELARWFAYRSAPQQAGGPAAYLSWLDWSLSSAGGIYPAAARGTVPGAELPQIEPEEPTPAPPVAGRPLSALLAARPALGKALAPLLALEPELLDRPLAALPARLVRALHEAGARPAPQAIEELRRIAVQLPPGAQRAGVGASLFGSKALDSRAPGRAGRQAAGFRPLLGRELAGAVSEQSSRFLPPGMVANLLAQGPVPARLEQQVQRLVAQLPVEVSLAELGDIARPLLAPLAEEINGLLGRLSAAQQPQERGAAAASRPLVDALLVQLERLGGASLARALAQTLAVPTALGERGERFSAALPSLGFLGYPFMPPLANELDRRLESGLFRSFPTGMATAHYLQLLERQGPGGLPGDLVRPYSEPQDASGLLARASATGTLGRALGYLPPAAGAAMPGRPGEVQKAESVQELQPRPWARPAGLPPEAGAGRSPLGALLQVGSMAGVSPAALPGLGLLGRAASLPAGITLADLTEAGWPEERPPLAGESLTERLARRGDRYQDLVRLDRFSPLTFAGSEPVRAGLAREPLGTLLEPEGEDAAARRTEKRSPSILARQPARAPLALVPPEEHEGTLPGETQRMLREVFPRGVPAAVLQKIEERYPQGLPSTQALDRLVAEVAAEQSSGPLGQAARLAEREALAARLARRMGLGSGAEMEMLRSAFSQLSRGILFSLHHLPYRWVASGLPRDLIAMTAGSESEAVSSVLDRMLGERGFVVPTASEVLEDRPLPTSMLHTRQEEMEVVEPPSVPKEEVEAVRRAAQAMQEAAQREEQRIVQAEQQQRRAERARQQQSQLRRTLELAETLFPATPAISQFVDAPASQMAFPGFLDTSVPVDLTLVAPMAQQVELQAAPLYSKPDQGIGEPDVEEQKQKNQMLDEKTGLLAQHLSPDKVEDMANRLIAELQKELLDANDIRGIQSFQSE